MFKGPPPKKNVKVSFRLSKVHPDPNLFVLGGEKLLLSKAPHLVVCTRRCLRKPMVCPMWESESLVFLGDDRMTKETAQGSKAAQNLTLQTSFRRACTVLSWRDSMSTCCLTSFFILSHELTIAGGFKPMGMCGHIELEVSRESSGIAFTELG